MCMCGYVHVSAVPKEASRGLWVAVSRTAWVLGAIPLAALTVSTFSCAGCAPPQVCQPPLSLVQRLGF